MSNSKLNLDQAKIARARELSKQIAAPVTAYIEKHTTVAIERTTLRMMGADGIDKEGIPIPNKIVDQLGENLILLTLYQLKKKHRNWFSNLLQKSEKMLHSGIIR